MSMMPGGGAAGAAMGAVGTAFPVVGAIGAIAGAAAQAAQPPANTMMDSGPANNGAENIITLVGGSADSGIGSLGQILAIVNSSSAQTGGIGLKQGSPMADYGYPISSQSVPLPSNPMSSMLMMAVIGVGLYMLIRHGG